MSKKKVVLICGGSGFLGKNFINFFLNKNYKIISTIHKNKSIISDKRISYIKVDLTNIKNCKKIFKNKNIDYVIMCAANTSGAKVMEKTPLVHLTPNVVMNVNMLEAAYENKIKKFLFISSNAVYPLTNKAVTEKDVDNTFFKKYYIGGWMKRFSEIVCNIYAEKIKKPMQVVVVRPGNIYGPNDKFDLEKAKVIPSLIAKVIHNTNKLDVWGDGKDLKDFIFVEDFVEGSVKALLKSSKNFSIFNIASGKSINIRYVIKNILKIMNIEKQTKINYQLDMPRMIPVRKINIQHSYKILKWKPKTSLYNGLKKTIKWYKKNYELL